MTMIGQQAGRLWAALCACCATFSTFLATAAMCSEAFLAFTRCHGLHNQFLLQSLGLQTHESRSRNAGGRGLRPSLEIYDDPSRM